MNPPEPALHSTLAAAAIAVVLATTGCHCQASVTTSGSAPPATWAAETAGLKTFTFPDGHISFSYPAGWKVQTKQGPYLDEASKAGSVEAAVLDESGSKVAGISSGAYGDGAAGPVKRTVLDHAPVPGITDASGKPAEFGFALDEIQPDGSSYYFMDVRLAAEFLPTQDSSGSNQIPLRNGIMAAYVVFDYTRQPVFATPAAATAWLATEKYKQLKSLLLSLRYT